MRSLSPSRFTEMNLGSKSGSICGPFTWRSYIRYVCLCQHAPFENAFSASGDIIADPVSGTQPPASWRSHCQASPSPLPIPRYRRWPQTEALLDAIDRYLCPASPDACGRLSPPYRIPDGLFAGQWFDGRCRNAQPPLRRHCHRLHPGSLSAVIGCGPWCVGP